MTMAFMYRQAGESKLANWCEHFMYDDLGVGYKFSLDGQNCVRASRVEIFSLVTEYRKENIDALLELGFEVNQDRIILSGQEGTTQLWSSPFDFYVGDDSVTGRYTFSQDNSDLTVIEDDILLELLGNGLTIPKIEGDQQYTYNYYLELSGDSSVEVYRQLDEIRTVVEGLKGRTEYSDELVRRNREIVDRRFRDSISRVLRPLPGADEDVDRFYSDRAEKDRARLLGCMSKLMAARRDEQTWLYGGLIHDVKTAATGMDYDPEPAIRNILDGNYLFAVPSLSSSR